MNNQGMRQGPFADADKNYDAIRKARELRNKSKIPRIRTMKKILKQVKARKELKIVNKPSTSTGSTDLKAQTDGA
jgi:hypothetical protein